MRGIRPGIVLLGLLASMPLARAQAPPGTLAVTVQSSGAPVRGARVTLLTGQRALSLPLTDVAGQSAAPVNVQELADQYAEVFVEHCPSQQPEVLVSVNRLHPPPAPEAACMRHKAGFFIPQGGGPWHITVDVEQLNVQSAGPPPQVPLNRPHAARVGLWGEASFGAGVSFIPGAAGNCANLSSTLLGANCTVTDTQSIGLLGNGSVNWRRYGGEGGFWRTGTTQFTANGAVNGAPGTVVSSFSPLGVYAAGAAHFFLTRLLSVTPKAGLTYWRVDFKQQQTVGTGLPLSTSSTLTGFSPLAGVSADATLFDHFGVGADYLFVPLRHSPVLSQNTHMMYFHVFYRIGRQ